MTLKKDPETTCLVSEETESFSTTYDSISEDNNEVNAVIPVEEDDDFDFLSVPNILFIEASLFTNVFLSGFDGTVTASTYTAIGNHFNAANIASWITTSYLITSTAFQPLYGSISDVIGRRKCVFFAIVSFSVGCLGCSIAPNIFILNTLRALTGIGSGGLINLSTIINSDIVPTRKRGIIQACQNLFLGFGAVCGASFGGYIAQSFGWRWCFLSQIPPCCWSIYIGYYYIQNQKDFDESKAVFSKELLHQIDVKGAVVLVTALTVQLLFLTLAGNELAWTDIRLHSLAVVGVILTIYFIRIELTTEANPIMPIKYYKNWFTVFLLGVNFMIGLSAYAYLFALPQLFHIVLGDTTSQAGLRLAIPSLSTPLGGLTTGIMMNKYRLLRSLVFTGTIFMTLGNFLVLLVNKATNGWLLALLLVPANYGQGVAYPSSLFTFIFAYGPRRHATSTSTTYLMRSIGGVWGVSGVSAIIQTYLRLTVEQDLADDGLLSAHEIHKIVRLITKSTDNIALLPEHIRTIVYRDYETGIRYAQLFSSVSCLLAVVFFFLSSILKFKPPPHT